MRPCAPDALPLLGEIGAHNYERYDAVLRERHAREGDEGALPVFWLFVNASCCTKQRPGISELNAGFRVDLARSGLPGRQHAGNQKSQSQSPPNV